MLRIQRLLFGALLSVNVIQVLILMRNLHLFDESPTRSFNQHNPQLKSYNFPGSDDNETMFDEDKSSEEDETEEDDDNMDKASIPQVGDDFSPVEQITFDRSVVAGRLTARREHVRSICRMQQAKCSMVNTLINSDSYLQDYNITICTIPKVRRPRCRVQGLGIDYWSFLYKWVQVRPPLTTVSPRLGLT